MRLPVSGLEVRFRLPDGHDDHAILEATGNVVQQALSVLPRLALFEDRAGEDQLRWDALTVSDFEFGLLELRRFLLGDRVSCQFRCAAPGCRERMEIEFSIRAFLSGIAPKLPRGVRPQDPRQDGRPGWFALEGIDAVSFRLVEVRDQERVLGRSEAVRLLMRQCIEPAELDSRRFARIQRAMETMAPMISRPVEGVCAACGAAVIMPLHVPRLVMDELRMAAGGVRWETHAIAEAYHWEEAAILAMPQVRRQAYAEMIRQVAL